MKFVSPLKSVGAGFICINLVHFLLYAEAKMSPKNSVNPHDKGSNLQVAKKGKNGKVEPSENSAGMNINVLITCVINTCW